MSDLNLHHLLLFHAVAETGSVTAASQRLLISQPAVSIQLKHLEEALRTPLFQRHPRKMTLTPAGEVLLEFARRIFQLTKEARIAIDELDSLQRGSLRVGASPTIATYLLPQLLVHFQRRFPKIKLYVEIEESESLERRLIDGLIEIALSPIKSQSDDLLSEAFMEEEFVGIAARKHPIMKHRKISAVDLANVLIARNQPSATGGMIEGYFARQQICTRPVISLGSVESAKQAAIAGLGATIISKMAVAGEIANRRLIQLNVAGLPMRRPLFQVRKSGPASKAAIAFGCLLKHAARGTLPHSR